MQAESSTHRSFNGWFYPAAKDTESPTIAQTLAADGFYSHVPKHQATAPEPIPQTRSHAPSADPVLSPAAMFLTGFSATPPAPVSPDSEGQVVSGYTLGPIIGYGGFSTIRKGTAVSGGVVAVKIITLGNLDKEAQHVLKLEHETWASLSHEHILPLYSATETSHAYFFFTQYCPAGSLFDILKRDGAPALPQDDAGMMFRQVVRGLRYLHGEAGLVHRDIKLENVLVDGMGVCRITDFGMAKKIGFSAEENKDEKGGEEKPTAQPQKSLHLSIHRSNKKSTPRHRASAPADINTSAMTAFQPGSLPYAAPELISSKGCVLDPAQDIWALGVLLYALLTGTFPFMDAFEPRLHMKILRGTYDAPLNVGRGAERILDGCLRRKIEDRWTIAMVDDIAWGVGWGDVQHDEEVLTPSNSRSRSRAAQNDTEWGLASIDERESFERPSLEAARRRSSSRAERSRSRAPSNSRHSRNSSAHKFPISAIPNSIMRALSNSTSTSISTSASSFQHSTPSSSRERGRQPTKFYDDVFIASPNSPITLLDRDSPARRFASYSPVYDTTARSRERGRRTVRLTDEIQKATESTILDEHTVWSSPVETRSQSRGKLLEFPGLGKLMSWVRGGTKEDLETSRRSGSVPPNALRLGFPSNVEPRSHSVASHR